MQKLFAAMVATVLTTGLIGCEFRSIADKVLPVKETVSVTPTSKASSSSSFTALEQSIHQQINQYRQSLKLSTLTLDPRISELARIHSQNMANGKVPFSHQGFEQRVQNIRQVITYRAASENVAFNQGYTNPGQQAVQGWIESNGHRVNIEGQYNLTGIGIVKNAKGEYYFTQIFILRR